MITAKDIRESTFSRAARGYKVDEIDEYLEKVADSVEKLTEENKTLVKKMEILASKVQEYREDEDNIRAALITAQRSADAIVKEAKRSVEARSPRPKPRPRLLLTMQIPRLPKFFRTPARLPNPLWRKPRKKRRPFLWRPKTRPKQW